MGSCNISTGSLASYTLYGGSTGNVSLTTISSRMGKRAMRAHYAGIRDHAQKTERPILEFNLGDEWGVLCEFLEVGIPDYPYPRENEGGDWILKMRERARMRAMAAAFRFVSVGLPIAVLAFGAWAWRPVSLLRASGLESLV